MTAMLPAETTKREIEIIVSLSVLDAREHAAFYGADPVKPSDSSQ